MKKSCLLGAACACLTLSLPAYGVDKYWVCNNSAWDSSCWSLTSGGASGAGQPLAGEDVYLTQSDSLDRIVSYQNNINPADTLNYLSINASGPGSMSLTQSQDVLNVQTVIVGDSGTGTYNQTGGSLNTTNIYLGYSNSGSGTMSVSDTGSVHTTNGFYVGHGGTGNLSILSGGTVTGLWGFIGNGNILSGPSYATIDGIGSSWTTTSILAAGYNSTGTLTIQNGGIASSGYGFVGSGGNGNGTAIVTGIGSSWNSTNHFVIASYGIGSLTVSGGGSVSGTDAYIGRYSGSSGDVDISGIGSSMATTGDIYVGDQGTGILSIASGGTVSSTSGWLGFQGAGSGTATVSGSGSEWSITNSLGVGVLGAGTLNIEDGGSVSALGVRIATNSSSSSGSVTVAGTNSVLTSSVSSGFTIGDDGTGDLDINTGGKVTSNSSVLGYFSGASGNATVSGMGSSWVNTNGMNIGREGEGTLSVTNGASVSNSADVINLGTFAGSVGTMTISDNGSNFSTTNSMYVGGRVTGAGGAGTLNVTNNGTVTVGGDMKVWETGTVNLNGGDLTVTGTYTTSGDTVINGNLSANAVEVLDGKVAGNGMIIGDLMNKGGKVGPGNSPGTLTIDGSYTQEAGAELIIEIAGLNPGEFDVLNILGTATFDPGTTIDLSFIGGFAPSTDDLFDFLLAETFASDMSLVNFTTSGLAEGFQFDVDFSDSGTFSMTALNDGVSTVPVPAAVWLFGSGLVGLVGLGRRRKAA